MNKYRIMYDVLLEDSCIIESENKKEAELKFYDDNYDLNVSIIEIEEITDE